MKETAARIAKARTAAAVLLQSFALRRAERRRLAVRFAARHARLDFERRNRAELASACLVLYAPSSTIRDCAGPEDFESMADAVKPALAVARMRASAASRGVSLEDMSRSARVSGSVGEGHDGEEEEEEEGGGGGGGRRGGSTAVGPTEGALLALAVLQQEDTQRRAAVRVQRAVRRKKAQNLLDERFRLQKVKLEKAKRDRGARRVQRAWSAVRLRREVTKRAEMTARRVEAEREAASRRLQKLCRRRKDAKELASRFTIRKIILEQVRIRVDFCTSLQLKENKRVGYVFSRCRCLPFRASSTAVSLSMCIAAQPFRGNTKKNGKNGLFVWKKIDRRACLKNSLLSSRAKLTPPSPLVIGGDIVIRTKTWCVDTERIHTWYDCFSFS